MSQSKRETGGAAITLDDTVMIVALQESRVRTMDPLQPRVRAVGCRERAHEVQAGVQREPGQQVLFGIKAADFPGRLGSIAPGGRTGGACARFQSDTWCDQG